MEIKFETKLHLILELIERLICPYIYILNKLAITTQIHTCRGIGLQKQNYANVIDLIDVSYVV